MLDRRLTMTSAASPEGDLRLGHVLHAAGFDDDREVIAIRHTVRPKDPTSLRDLSPEGVLAYTRVQKVETNIFPRVPPPLWLIFLADGQRGTNSRFHIAYDNRGEVEAERTENVRSYDLHPSSTLTSLRNRLVVDWGAGAIGWAKRGPKAAASRSSRSRTRPLSRSPATATFSSPTTTSGRSWRIPASWSGAPHSEPSRASTRSPTPAPAGSMSARRTEASASLDDGPSTPWTGMAGTRH